MLSLPVFKCRIWETHFQVFKAIASLPQPYVAVLERQNGPRYHVECRSYQPDSAMLRVTLQGEGVFRKGGKTYALPPGKAYFIPDRLEGGSYYYPSYAKGDWLFLWFGFKGPCVRKMMDDFNERYGYVFDLPLKSGVVKYIESMKNLSGKVQALSPTAGAKIVMDVLAGVGDVIERPQLENPNVELVRNAQTALMSELENGPRISDLAERLGVSREHLSRVFKEQTGVSPLEFAERERMRLAAQTLRGGRTTCKEMASRLGYESASSFARAFKRIYGRSPGSHGQLKAYEA